MKLIILFFSVMFIVNIAFGEEPKFPYQTGIERVWGGDFKPEERTSFCFGLTFEVSQKICMNTENFDAGKNLICAEMTETEVAEALCVKLSISANQATGCFYFTETFLDQQKCLMDLKVVEEVLIIKDMKFKDLGVEVDNDRVSPARLVESKFKKIAEFIFAEEGLRLNLGSSSEGPDSKAFDFDDSSRGNYIEEPNFKEAEARSI